MTASAFLDHTKLDAIPGLLQTFIDRGDLAGLVSLTWRRGDLVQTNALGWRDLEGGVPMRRDDLFRIASMTKPITSVATMMLVERGAIRLDDAVQRWVPELANLRVLRDPDGPVDDTVPAHRPITVEDLLTHRSGLTYGLFATGPIAEAYRAALGDRIQIELSPDAWLAALGQLPLVHQPGELMLYSHATDVLGLLVGRIVGRSFRDALRDLVLDPLGMHDTDFYLPAAKRDRIANVYRFDEGHGALAKVDLPVPDHLPSFASGGAGLVGSADDYLTFARMLLGRGEVDGVRLLKARTVQAMCRDRLTPVQRAFPFIGRPIWTGMGFGLGLGIVDAPDKSLLGSGSVGSFTWPGAWGTWWQADPVEQIVLVYMVQHFFPLSAEAGEVIAGGGRGVAGREALPVFESRTYDALVGDRAPA